VERRGGESHRQLLSQRERNQKIVLPVPTVLSAVAPRSSNSRIEPAAPLVNQTGTFSSLPCEPVWRLRRSALKPKPCPAAIAVIGRPRQSAAPSCAGELPVSGSGA
jgi:hypothetical protein